MKKLFLVTLLLLLTSCSNYNYLDKQDSKTGLFPTKVEANVIKNTKINLDSLREFIVVTTDFRDQDNLKQAITKMGYFDMVTNVEDGLLADLIIQNDLTHKIPELSSRATLNKIAKHYKPFLWLDVELGKRDSLGSRYMRFNLRNALSFESYFIAEASANDRDALFNALSHFIKQNTSQR